MSDKVREADGYVAALKKAACSSGDLQNDAYMDEMIDSVVGIVRAAALEEAAEALRVLRPNSEGYRRDEWAKFNWDLPCADAIDKGFDIGIAAIRALAQEEKR